MTRCFGPDWSAVMNGRFTSVCIVVESSIFAFSAASLRRCRAWRSFRRSMPWSFLNSSTSQSMIRWSKSSPPRWVSPFVAFTSNTPSPSCRIEMSNVPPPRSYTATTSSFFLSRPYASAAAVGSLTMRRTSSPAIWPASLVAWRWLSSKYAGTVMTAWMTLSPRKASASVFSLLKIIAQTSGGERCLPSARTTSTPPFFPSAILYETRFLLRCTSGSLNRRPMKRLIE